MYIIYVYIQTKYWPGDERLCRIIQQTSLIYMGKLYHMTLRSPAMFGVMYAFRKAAMARGFNIESTALASVSGCVCNRNRGDGVRETGSAHATLGFAYGRFFH